MQSDLVERFGYPEQRSVVINNPVDVDYVRIQSAFPLNHSGRQVGKIWLVAAGRMEHVKGFDLLIEASCRRQWSCGSNRFSRLSA
jgi:glycosyltransferase involved in cell wall biosynthesis